MEISNIEEALRPGSELILATIRNHSDREDVKETSRKHYIKSIWSFESLIDADLNIHSLEGYEAEKVISIRAPYIKLRYSGENFIKSYPKAGAEYTERKIISRSRDYFFWNSARSELVSCDKKTISTIAEVLVKHAMTKTGSIPATLKKRKEYKNGQVQFALETRQGTILVKLRSGGNQ